MKFKRRIQNSSFVLFMCFCLIFSNGCKTYHVAENPEKLSPATWKIGSSTSLIKQLAPEMLHEVKKSGIDFLEIGWKDLNKSEITFEERLSFAHSIYKQSLKAGITIWSTHVPYGLEFDISNLNNEKRKATVALVKEYIDLAAAMKVKYVVLHGSEPIKEDTRAQRILNCRESLKKLSAYAKLQGIALAIECLPPDFLGNSSKEMLSILQGIENVGICFDTNHLFPEKPEDFVSAVGKKISTVHIADFDGVQQKHWMPGRGVINWNKVIDQLVKIEYTGPFMYEVVRRGNEQHTFKDLQLNFESLKAAWAKSNNQ